MATLELGGATAVREQVRMAGWAHTLETLFSDVRYAMRGLQQNPGFAVVMVLALAGGAVGLLFAEFGVSAILKGWPAVLPRTHQIGVDPVTLVYALLISLLAGVAFGFAPAWRSSATEVYGRFAREAPGQLVGRAPSPAARAGGGGNRTGADRAHRRRTPGAQFCAAPRD